MCVCEQREKVALSVLKGGTLLLCVSAPFFLYTQRPLSNQCCWPFQGCYIHHKNSGTRERLTHKVSLVFFPSHVCVWRRAGQQQSRHFFDILHKLLYFLFIDCRPIWLAFDLAPYVLLNIGETLPIRWLLLFCKTSSLFFFFFLIQWSAKFVLDKTKCVCECRHILLGILSLQMHHTATDW